MSEDLLSQLARKHQTDKGGNHLMYGGQPSTTCHNYTPIYHRLFESFRLEAKNVLEIGVNAGSSLRMWRDYFPSAQIVGLDIRPEVLFQEDRIRCIQADQNNFVSLCRAIEQLPAHLELFDVIIDDGSHEPEHQLTSLKTLLPLVKPDGYYIIEDLGPNFSHSESLYHAVPEGYTQECIPVYGGIGGAAGREWLFVVKRL
jgi:demethylmacrocin O-methyltransferase